MQTLTLLRRNTLSTTSSSLSSSSSLCKTIIPAFTRSCSIWTTTTLSTSSFRLNHICNHTCQCSCSSRMTSLLSTSMMNNTPKRMMSGGNFLSEEEVEARVLFVLSKINKIHDNPQALRTLSKDSTFESLGLDSLDQVEVIMQLEEEFVVDLQDDEAGKMTTVRDCIRVFSNFPYAIPIRGGFH